MIAFYTDENVHGAIIEGLRQRHVDVLRVQDDGYMERDDDEILDRATELARVLFSQTMICCERQRSASVTAQALVAWFTHTNSM